MAFENNTNHGRVQKMVEILGLIEKSAKSNGADNNALKSMLRPLFDALPEIKGVSAGGAGPERPNAPEPALTAGQRAALHLADGASLRDLIAALLGRLEAQAAHLAASDQGD